MINSQLELGPPVTHQPLTKYSVPPSRVLPIFSSSEFDENIGFFARENIPHTSLFSVRFDPLNGVLILNRGRWYATFRLELCAVCCHKSQQL